MSPPAARLRAAIARHDELVARIARRRALRDELAAGIAAAVRQFGARMEAVLAEALAVDDEIHQLFRALLADRARPASERAAIGEVYQALCDGGLLQPPGWTPGPARAGRGRAPDDPGDVSGARTAGADAAPAARSGGKGPLRALYRRLVEALHPDRAGDDDERARRTELMKQVTVAYQDGDYARLVEVERAWSVDLAAMAPPAAVDTVGDQLAQRARAIAVLEAQLAELDDELAGLRASEHGQAAHEFARHGGADGLTPDEQAAQDDLARLRALRDLVRAFRDGVIDLPRFLAGPGRSPPAAPVAEREAIDAELADVAELLSDPPPELARLAADLARAARAEGLSQRELVRLIEAAAASAGAGRPPRRR